MPASETPAETPTVTRYVVVSNRDGEHVVGPLDKRGDADSECDRLSQEQTRNWLAGGETAIGEPLKPPGYTVEPIEVPDPAARRAFVESELKRVAQRERKLGKPSDDEPVELTTERDGLAQDRERFEIELNA